MKIEAIDLFCGVGGLTYGLQQAGIKVIAGIDNDSSCKYAYEKNNRSKFIAADISNYDFNELSKLYSRNAIKVLVGCAPCQPFSSHSFKNKNKEVDTRWNLIDYFMQAIKTVQPEVVSMENVRGLTKTEIFQKFISELESQGYQVDYKVIQCQNYGLPQSRNRLVLLASRLGEIQIPQETHNKNNYVTIKDALKNVPRLNAGETCKTDHLHRSRNLSPLNLQRIKNSKPNGTWENWDIGLLPECYKKKSGETFKSVYGRLSWDSISATITTQFYSYGSGRFGHPTEDRALSIREGALLQSFPHDYDFGENITFSTTGRQIGNAVPPKLGLVIGQSIHSHLITSRGAK